MSKRITFIRVALSFLIVCLLVVPLDVKAATNQYVSLDHYSVSPRVETESISFSVGNNYIFDGLSNASSTNVYTIGEHEYGVYHFKHTFDDILTIRNNEDYTYDSYVLQSYDDVAWTNVYVVSSLGDFSNSYCQIKNLTEYYEFYIDGNVYKSEFFMPHVYIDTNKIGRFTIRPVVEFDVILDLEHFQNDITDSTTSFTLELKYTVSNTFHIDLYGGNYISTGENVILSKLDNLISTITSKFDSLSTFLTSKFSELFKIMEDDQEELINGFQGSGTDQASTNFDTSARELHSAETQLTNVTNTSVNTYTDFAFDTTVLTTLGASLVYVVTWFTNFWDIGGLFTALLNIGLALFVAFFILRLRGSK